MSGIDFTVTDNSQKAIEAKDAAILKYLEEAGLHLEGQAAKALEMDPRRVDTGLLRNSITHALDGEGAAISTYSADKPDKSGVVKTGSYSGATPKEPKGSAAVYVGSNVEYGAYVHEGTSKMAPNRFIRNAFEANKGQLKDKLEEALKNA